jgi:predicted Fe-Mo cluster-binding NifX family protein
MMSDNRLEAQMSAHFGKAEWAMVADTQCHSVTFLKNDAARCKAAVELIADLNCTDAIFTEIGNGALAHLRAATIRGWLAPPNITGRQALEMFEHLRLLSAEAPAASPGAGCTCSHHANAETHACCHQ